MEQFEAFLNRTFPENHFNVISREEFNKWTGPGTLTGYDCSPSPLITVHAFGESETKVGYMSFKLTGTIVYFKTI